MLFSTVRFLLLRIDLNALNLNIFIIHIKLVCAWCGGAQHNISGLYSTCRQHTRERKTKKKNTTTLISFVSIHNNFVFIAVRIAEIAFLDHQFNLDLDEQNISKDRNDYYECTTI